MFFPSFNSGYADITAGSTEFSFNRAVYGIQLTGRRDSLKYTDSVYLKSTYNFENGKFYSVHLIDSVPNLKVLVFEDKFTNYQDTLTRVRFINLLTKNGTKNDTLELVRRRGNTILAKSVTFGGVSDFSAFPITPAGISDSLYYRRVNTTTAYPGLGGFIFPGSLTKGRNHTVVAYGTSSRATGLRSMIYVNQ
ncbi:MAG: DUF4397 domain-containing protein [Saprospiraceae bacterium]|nr:DUF4397 domain-containing protein [Saprospiraceae bacterium]